MSPLASLAAEFSVAVRFALREMRGGVRGFAIFLAAIALGVAAIAGVGSLSRGMTDGIAREGRSILGGDVAVSLVQRQVTPEERAFLEQTGSVSEVATLRAMARKADGSGQALVELKAVDDAYPLVGAVAISGGGDLHRLLATDGAISGGVAEAELLARLGLSVGDVVGVGGTSIRIAGVIGTEPDRLTGGFSLGPRLMVSRAALDRAALLQPGSLVTWTYRVKLPGEPDAGAVKAAVAAAATAFPDAGWRIRTREDAAPGLRRNIERFAEYLTLIGLTALIVGGVGVANVVASYLDTKREVIATLKCLGAPGRLAVLVYLVQIVLLAAAGIVAGLAVGAAVPFAAGAALRQVLPVDVAGVYPAELALAALYGLAVALAFALVPLGRARAINAAALFRDKVAPLRARTPAAYVAGAAAAMAVFAGLAVGLAYDQRVAAIFVAAAAVSFILLRAVAAAIMAAARRAPRTRSPGFRLAVGNIHRPGALTPSVVLSLGLGLTLVVTLVLIDGNFRRELIGSIPATAPSFFFLDLQSSEVDGFKAFVAKEAPAAKLEIVPMIRGRLTKIAGVPIGEVAADPGARWVLDGDRGITFAAELPKESRLSEGTWWPADYDGPPLVSFEAEVAKGLHLKRGDTVTVNVLGREVTARVANFRSVEWQSLAINFVMVFSPNAFRGAPFANLATLSFPDGGTLEEELSLLKRITAAFPAVTAVRVKEALETANGIVERIGWATRGASAITLVASVLVLGGAIAAGRRQRIYDAVILKTLGATRAQIAGAFGLEFLLVGLATAVFGLFAGTLAAWFVIASVMGIGFTFLAGPALGAGAVALLLTLAFGLAGTWRALRQKAAPVLREL